MTKYFVGNLEHTYKDFEPSTIQDCYDYCIQQKVIAIDIETTRKYPPNKYVNSKYQPGLDPYLTNILMFQIGTLEKAWVIDVRVIDIKPLIPLLENRNILKVGANLAFESIHFLHNYNIHIQGLYDVLLVDRIMTNGLYDNYSLKALRMRYRNHKSKDTGDLFGGSSYQRDLNKVLKELIDNFALFNGREPDELEMESLTGEAEEIIDEKYVDKEIRMQFLNWGEKPFTLEQVTYGLEDITEPLHLRNLFLRGRKVVKNVNKDGSKDYEQYYPEAAIRQENKLIELLAFMKYHGVCIDTNLWVELAEKQYKTYYEKKAILDTYIVEKYPQFTDGMDIFTSTPICAIKWSSAKQVIELFDLLELTATEISKSTGKMAKTVGAKALLKSLPNEYKTAFMNFAWPEKFENKYDICLHYLLMKKTQQLMTTYGRDFLEYVHPITGKIHCNFRQYLNTGRMAATSPNALALPRSQEYRNCFIAPTGYKVWACDYTS